MPLLLDKKVFLCYNGVERRSGKFKEFLKIPTGYNMTKTTHGQAHSRIYNIWSNMKQRCYNEKSQAYHSYGGRGIIVCSEWHDFNNFYKWAISHGYSDNLTIDRINVNGNYEPSNCRWISRAEQNKNRRDNVWLTYRNETYLQSEWEKIKGYKRGVIGNRLKRGWSVEQAITISVGNYYGKETKQYTINGVTYSQRELCRVYNIPESTFRNRLKRGLTVEQAIGIKPQC